MKSTSKHSTHSSHVDSKAKATKSGSHTGTHTSKGSHSTTHKGTTSVKHK